ncbi:hypothetical protein B0J14DRAFT_562033 [Halenospora varia]|nr:hypothetical protein B0J14DRAFT_562033 [Halenospora varia]
MLTQAARDANGNWYKVKGHEAKREVGMRDSEQPSAKSTSLSQPQDDDPRRGRLTIHGARYASDTTKAKRHRSASSSSKNIFEESNINHTKSKGGYGGSSHDATKAGDWCSLRTRSRRQKLYRHKVQEHWKHQKASGFHLTRQELRRITHQELKLCIKLQRFTKNPPRDVPKAEVLDFAERVYDRDPSIMRKESVSVTLCHLDSREDLEKFARHALVDWIQLQGSETTYEANKAQLLELAQKIYNGDPQLVP